MTSNATSRPIAAEDVPLRRKKSNYPEPFASRMAGREKRQLGEVFSLTRFGVNLTTLDPGQVSSLRHAHTTQDEFIYVVQGFPTLVDDHGETQLSPGMCAGFKAGTGNAHHLVNRSPDKVTFLEIGDRSEGDEVAYPDDDIQARLEGGKWVFRHKDGVPY